MPQPTPQYGQLVRTAGGCGDKVFMTGSRRSSTCRHFLLD
jgi:hypothetical protein